MGQDPYDIWNGLPDQVDPWSSLPDKTPPQPNYQPPPSSYQPPAELPFKFANPSMPEPEKGFFEQQFTWPNAVRMAGSTAGDYIGGLLAPVTFGAAYPIASFIGGAGSELAAQLMEGKSPNWGSIGTEGALNLIPGPNIPGKGALASDVMKFGAKTAGSGALQGFLGATPRHIAETGQWELPSVGEFAGQTGIGAVAGGATGLGLAGGHQLLNKMMPSVPATPDIKLPEQNINPNLESTNIIPPRVSNIPVPQQDGPHLITIKDYSVVPYWKERGYVIVPGLKSADNYQQMARADVAPLYRDYKNSKIKPTELTNDEDVLNLMDQMRSEEATPPTDVPPVYTKENVPGAIGEGYVAEGAKEVTIPNDIVNGPFIQNMRESGFQIADKTPTHTIFKPLDPNMHVEEPPVNPNLDELFDKLRTTIDTGEANQPVGEVESGKGAYDVSPKMTKILADVFMSDERGALNEFEIRKHVRNILTATDPEQIRALSKQFNELHFDHAGKPEAKVYKALADAAFQRRIEVVETNPIVRQHMEELGDLGPNVDTQTLARGMHAANKEQLYDHLDQLQQVLKKGESGNDADVEALMQKAEDLIVNETDPAIIEDHVRQVHDYAKSGGASADEQELFGQLYDIARTKHNGMNDPASQGDLKNRIISDVTGGPQQPPIRAASFNPAIPEGGGIDVAGIRQRNLFGERPAFEGSESLFGRGGVAPFRRDEKFSQFLARTRNIDIDDFMMLPSHVRQSYIAEYEIAQGRDAPHGDMPGPDDPRWTENQPKPKIDKPDEIPSNNPNAPPPPREELTPFQRRRQRIINSFNEVLPEAKSWLKTRFIMPSGKKLTHTHAIHESAAIEAGTTLQGALEAGIIRVGERFGGIEIHAPITMAQAQVLADAPHYIGKGIYVDVSAAREARSVNGSKNFRQFGEESTAREIYDWVNKIAKRSENDIAHLESRTSRDNAIDTWETMTRIPYADKGPIESVIYDRNEKLNRDEKLALSKNPLMLDVHERISSIIEKISHLSQSGLTSWVRRSGTVVDPGVMGLFKQNPDFEDFSAILLNTLEHIKRGETPEIAAKNMLETLYHELGHIDTGGTVTKYDPREAMQDPRIGKGFQDYIRQLVMNGEADRYHDISWMNRVIDLQMKVGVEQNAQFEKQLAEALSGGQSGRYRPEVPELLRIYQEAAGRERPTPDILSAAGIEQANTGSAAAGSVSGNAQSTGAGVPPPGSSGGGGFFRGTLGWGQGATKGGSRTAKDEVNWVREAMAVPSSVTTTGDLSFPGRQGLSLIFTPQFWQAAGKMFKGGLSQAGFDAMNAELAKKPLMAKRLNTKTGKMDQSLGKELGLKIYKLASQAGPHAEGIASRWLERGIGKTTKDPLGNKTWQPTTGSKAWENTFGIPVKAANRAFLTMLNHLSVNRAEFLMNKARDMSIQGLTSGSVRPGIFGKSVDKNEAMDLNPYYNKVLGKEIIDFVNTATGHGPLRTHLLPAKQTEINLEGASKVLSSVLFSPGLLASRVRFMNPSTYIMASPYVRKQYMKSALSTVAAWYGFTEMAKLAAGDQAEVSNDPTSADFGKVRIGDTRLDPGGGFLQFAVAYSRLYQGGATSSSTGQFHKFGEGYQAQTSEDMMERFMVNKLNPVTKFAYDVASASEYNPFHVGDRTIQMFVPLFIQDLMEISKEDPTLLPAMGTAAMFGMGTQIYSKGESVGKIVPPESDWLVKGGGIRDLWGGGQ